MTIDERDEMRRDETNDMNDVMNTRAMRALFQSFRQPRPRLRRQNVGFGDVIFVHGVNRVPRTERSDTPDTARVYSIIWSGSSWGGSGIRESFVKRRL